MLAAPRRNAIRGNVKRPAHLGSKIVEGSVRIYKTAPLTAAPVDHPAKQMNSARQENAWHVAKPEKHNMRTFVSIFLVILNIAVLVANLVRPKQFVVELPVWTSRMITITAVDAEKSVPQE